MCQKTLSLSVDGVLIDKCKSCTDISTIQQYRKVYNFVTLIKLRLQNSKTKIDMMMGLFFRLVE